MSTAASAARDRIAGNGIGRSHAHNLPRTGEHAQVGQGEFEPPAWSFAGCALVFADVGSVDVALACFAWPGSSAVFEDVVGSDCWGVATFTFAVATGFALECAVVELARLADRAC